MRLTHAHGELEIDRCLVMGIVNRTPDSFYDGGRMGLQESVDFAARLVDEGADLVDLGAVKAGPGPEVPPEEEAERLMPLLEAVAARVSAPVSVETADPKLAHRAIEAGAAIVNDVRGLTDEGLAEVCAGTGAALVLMHSGGQIRGRPRHPRYSDVVDDVLREWDAMVARAVSAGMKREQLIVDPGLDFGKTTYHSLEIVRRLDELLAFGLPLMLAPSRKDVVGETLDLPLDERLEGTLAIVALAVAAGAHIVRVHDVKAAARTVAMTEAIAGRRKPARPLRGLWD
ncbi:MAG TPA: dihydropteroate synthase [Actinomycetota bacterium]|nr:dihydropteroate synthase [Actinomycetota bacterium]